PQSYIAPEMNVPPIEPYPAFEPPPFYSVPEPETQMFSQGLKPPVYYTNPISTPNSNNDPSSGRILPSSQANTNIFIPPSNWPNNLEVPTSTTSSFKKSDKLRKASFYSSELIKPVTEGNFSVQPPPLPQEKTTNKLSRKISSPITDPPSSRIITPSAYSSPSEEEKMRVKNSVPNLPYPLPKKNEGANLSKGIDYSKGSLDKGKSLTKSFFSQPTEERITPRMPSSIINPPSNLPLNPPSNLPFQYGKPPAKPEK
ncbi:MAG: hypothetical protein AABZ60_19695, partial [Planctomycetota bacterium]